MKKKKCLDHGAIFIFFPYTRAAKTKFLTHPGPFFFLGALHAQVSDCLHTPHAVFKLFFFLLFPFSSFNRLDASEHKLPEALILCGPMDLLVVELSLFFFRDLIY